MTGFITAIVLAIVFALLRKFAPPQEDQFKTNRSINELRAKYKTLDVIQIIAFIPMIAILAYVYFQLLVAAQKLYFSFYDQIEILVPNIESFVVAAGFAAMITSIILLVYLVKVKLKDDWAEYIAYKDMRYGFNTQKLGRLTLQIASILSIILLALNFDYYSIFRTNDIIINEFTSLGNKTYVYSDIKEIRDVLKSKAPNGNIVEEEHYVIAFKDGLKWNSRDNGFSSFEMDRKIAELLQRKTGKEIVKLEFDRESE